jgi:hypothetical protein
MLSPGSSWKGLFGTLQNIFLFKKIKYSISRSLSRLSGSGNYFLPKKCSQPHLRKYREATPAKSLPINGTKRDKKQQKTQSTLKYFFCIFRICDAYQRWHHPPSDNITGEAGFLPLRK